jgi:outer membrane murein-binding lipoprotein Lpp
MIRINLHDYRDELRKIEIQKRVVKSLAIIIVAIFFILASWLNEQAKLDLVKSETRKLQSQVAALTSEINLVKEMGGKVARLESIVLTIEGLREKQLPASTIIGDLNLMVPEGLCFSRKPSMVKTIDSKRATLPPISLTKLISLVKAAT